MLQNNTMVPKNRKNYPIIVRFLHQAAEKSNLNSVHVVDREKDGARIFFFTSYIQHLLISFSGPKKFLFHIFNKSKFPRAVQLVVRLQ